MGHLRQLSPGVNAYTIAFEDGVLEEARGIYQSVIAKSVDTSWLEGEEPRSGSFDREDLSFYFTTNLLGRFPLLWVSANNAPSHDLFHRFFDGLHVTEEVRQLVDHEDGIVVYCGFFILGSHADGEAWHVDYEFGSNAYTLVTPLFMPDESHGDLLYYDRDSEVSRYEYRAGEAILFGDNFYHSTERYERSENLRVLLSLTVGTDKMKYWPKLQKTVGRQSEFVILPCGDQRGACEHLEA